MKTRTLQPRRISRAPRVVLASLLARGGDHRRSAAQDLVVRGSGEEQRGSGASARAGVARLSSAMSPPPRCGSAVWPPLISQANNSRPASAAPLPRNVVQRCDQDRPVIALRREARCALPVRREFHQLAPRRCRPVVEQVEIAARLFAEHIHALRERPAVRLADVEEEFEVLQHLSREAVLQPQHHAREFGGARRGKIAAGRIHRADFARHLSGASVIAGVRLSRFGAGCVPATAGRGGVETIVF